VVISSLIQGALMQISILSDLHVNCRPKWVPEKIPDADLCVCAGDIDEGGVVQSVNWLQEHLLPSIPVLFVCGNHEFYGGSIKEGLEEGRRAAHGIKDFHFLDDDILDLGGIRFIGATLWTDFQLQDTPEISMTAAHWAMSDFRRIKMSKRPYKRFEPVDALRLHQASRAFLDHALEKSAGRPTVVVTHHAPSPRSIPAEYANSRLSPAFASDLEDLILKYQPMLWVHGHIHAPLDYRIGKTRIACNPLGYPGEIKPEHLYLERIINLSEDFDV
jgi:hypothetical protein